MISTTDFSIRSILGGYDKNFTYVITCNKTGIQVIIDAAIDLKHISHYLNNQPRAVLITHTHGDHTAYLEEYTKAFPNMIILGHPYSSTELYKVRFKSLEHKQLFNIGKLAFTAIHTPGHYFDSICYHLDSVLFTGDTLFVGRTGRVLSQRSNCNDLYNSVYKSILTLPKNTRIYPGHDYGDRPSITLEQNIKISPLLQAQNNNDFKLRMDDYEANRNMTC